MIPKNQKGLSGSINALQRTRPSRSGCNPRVPRAGSLSLGRYRDMKLHSILFGWSDPDQALRVAAGIPGKRASDGLWPSGQYCQGAKPSRQCTEPGSLNPG